jgi:hypothetical protein
MECIGIPRCLLWKRVPGYTIPMVPMHLPPMAPMNLVKQIRALRVRRGRGPAEGDAGRELEGVDGALRRLHARAGAWVPGLGAAAGPGAEEAGLADLRGAVMRWLRPPRITARLQWFSFDSRVGAPCREQIGLARRHTLYTVWVRGQKARTCQAGGPRRRSRRRAGRRPARTESRSRSTPGRRSRRRGRSAQHSTPGPATAPRSLQPWFNFMSAQHTTMLFLYTVCCIRITLVCA